MDLDALSVQDIKMISDLPQFDSLRSWAQSQNHTVAKASRLLKRIESTLQVELVRRTNKGIASTLEGEDLASKAREALQYIERFASIETSPNLRPFKDFLTIGTRGFLGSTLSPCLLRAVHNLNIGLKVLELSPKQTVDAAKAGALDVILGFEPLKLGKNWICESVGRLEWRIYGRYGHPLTQITRVGPRELETYRIAHNVFWDGKKLVTNEGLLNASHKIRQLGHGSQSAATAIAFAAETEQLVCVPKIVALDALKLAKVVEISTVDVKPIEVEVFLAVHTEQISNRVLKAIKSELHSKFSKLYGF